MTMKDNDDLLSRSALLSLKDKKVILGTLLVIVIGTFMWVAVKLTNPQKDLKPEVTLKPLSINSDMLATDEFQKFQEAFTAQNEVIQGLNDKIEALRMAQEKDGQQFDSLQKEISKPSSNPTTKSTTSAEKDQFKKELEDFKKQASLLGATVDEEQAEKKFRYPPSPIPPGKQSEMPNSASVSGMAANLKGSTSTTPQQQLIGGVGWVAGVAEPDKNIKAVKKYYMPPSFFPAKLLTGIDALTSKQGRDNLEQVFFMVDAPAVLPNYIKKDLSGCFVVANAHGNLAKERVQIQAVNLSCLSSDGNAVIDQKILGFVTDNGDGKRDLAGNVVSKDGSKMGWLIAASVAGEMGNSVNIESFEQTPTLIGTQSVLNQDKVLQRAGGASIQSTAESYKEIIMEYIKQSGPVIEMAPLKEGTVFLQEGVWLEIKDRGENSDA